jgi:hypothetical protein
LFILLIFYCRDVLPTTDYLHFSDNYNKLKLLLCFYSLYIMFLALFYYFLLSLVMK